MYLPTETPSVPHLDIGTISKVNSIDILRFINAHYLSLLVHQDEMLQLPHLGRQATRHARDLLVDLEMPQIQTHD